MLKAGDYVLATKWSDGDPCDQWCVGFFSYEVEGRYCVLDSDGVSFRHNGFRRCEKISKEQGDFALKTFPSLEGISGVNLWDLIIHPHLNNP